MSSSYNSPSDRRIMEPGSTKSSGGHEEENSTLVRRSLEDIWGKYDTKAVDKYFASNFVDHTPAPGYSPNRDGLKKSVNLYSKAFSNPRVTVEDLVAQGDEVAARFTFHGKHTGELQGIPPTGKDVTVIGMTICRLANGQVVESWESIDQLQMLQQLGAIQPPGSAPNR